MNQLTDEELRAKYSKLDEELFRRYNIDLGELERPVVVRITKLEISLYVIAGLAGMITGYVLAVH